MIRKRKLFDRPRKAFESARIKEENELVKRYGLKNKKEIWKTLAKVNYYRKRMMALTNSPHEEQEVFFGKLKALGLSINDSADVLALKVEDLLSRRIQTVLFKKKLANTINHSRQLIAHKKVIIGKKAISAPSYIVKTSEESLITIRKSLPKQKKEEPAPEQEVPAVESENVEASNGLTEDTNPEESKSEESKE